MGVAGRSGLARLLADALGEEFVAGDPGERLLYSHDIAPLPAVASLSFRMLPDAIVRPSGTEQLREVLRLAREHRFPVIPRGAATWGLGGAVPVQGGVVVDLTAMNRILSVSEHSVRAQAGATWQAALEAAKKKGLWLPTYPSSCQAATIGGWVSVNGVGIGTCKYGRLASNVYSLDVVLPGGKLVRAGEKNGRGDSHGPDGHDIGTFIGAEGTLGIVTSVSLRARPAPEIIRPCAFEFRDLAAAGKFLNVLSGNGIVPYHLMFADKKHYEMQRTSGLQSEIKGACVTVILDGDDATVEAEMSGIGQLAGPAGGHPKSEAVSKHEWEERSYEFRMRRMGVSTLPAEILVPVEKFDAVLGQAYRLIKEMGLKAAVIGTLCSPGTAMLMPYYIIDEKRPLDTMSAMTFNYRLARIAFSFGGTIVGLGLLFAFFARDVYGKGELGRQRALKRRYDPDGTLNPGHRLGTGTRFGGNIGPSMPSLAVKMLTLLRGKIRAGKK